LKCAAPKCQGYVAVVGEGYEEQVYSEEDGSTDWIPVWKPLFAWPMPNVFRIPEKCPPEVVAELQASFAALWNNRAAAAARLRVAVERLLDSVGIPKQQLTKAGRERLSLHSRIELVQKTNAEIANNLMGIKWLGNTGSHEDDVSDDDLLGAYEVIDHALEGLLKLKARHASALAKQLAKKHAPPKRRRKKAR
jgi:hypothetical protein